MSSTNTKKQLVTNKIAGKGRELNKFQVCDGFLEKKKNHLQLLFKRVARGGNLFYNIANI